MAPTFILDDLLIPSAIHMLGKVLIQGSLPTTTYSARLASDYFIPGHAPNTYAS